MTSGFDAGLSSASTRASRRSDTDIAAPPQLLAAATAPMLELERKSSQSGKCRKNYKSDADFRNDEVER